MIYALCPFSVEGISSKHFEGIGTVLWYAGLEGVLEGVLGGSYLRPTASMGSSSSLMSGWMLGPSARDSMLMHVNTVASTCMVFCLLGERTTERPT